MYYHAIRIGRHQVRRLMRLMGIEAIYPKRPKTSQSEPSHKKYPYLLRDLAIICPNQVWGTDITYIRLETGWAYLVAILDWYSRHVVAWSISPTLESDFCVATLNEALKTMFWKSSTATRERSLPTRILPTFFSRIL